jgi:transcriptional regulator with XRE-family HTH domain
MSSKTIKEPAAPDNSIASWREAMGLNQRDASEALGCSRTALGDWERDPPTTPRYIKLAMAALAMGMKVEA